MQVASWNSKGEGVSWTGILKAWWVTQFEIPNAWWGGGGGFSSEFPEGEDSESFS